MNPERVLHVDPEVLEVAFTVKGELPPSINRLMRIHWSKRDKLAADWGWLIKAEVKPAQVRTLHEWREARVRLEVTMDVVSPLLYDPDNLNSLAKIPLDAMVKLGFLWDDGPKYLDFEKPTQVRGPKSITFTFRRAGA